MDGDVVLEKNRTKTTLTSLKSFLFFCFTKKSKINASIIFYSFSVNIYLKKKRRKRRSFLYILGYDIEISNLFWAKKSLVNFFIRNQR